MSKLWRCTECQHEFEFANAQKAEHPFRDDQTIYGCPKCGEIEGWEELCEVAGCGAKATCGTPLKDRSGYIRCCFQHYAEQQDQPRPHFNPNEGFGPI